MLTLGQMSPPVLVPVPALPSVPVRRIVLMLVLLLPAPMRLLDPVVPVLPGATMRLLVRALPLALVLLLLLTLMWVQPWRQKHALRASLQVAAAASPRQQPAGQSLEARKAAFPRTPDRRHV